MLPSGPVLFHRIISLILLFSLASCSLIPASLNKNAAQNNKQQDREYLIPVTRGDIAVSTSFVGNLQYSQSSTLTWKTGGVVGSVSAKVGDKVKKGDILAVLETESLSSSVILAEKTMIEQQEKLEDTKSSESARMQAYVNLNAKESALKKAKLEQEALYYPRATRQDMELAWDSLALANLNFNYAKQDYDALVAKNETWEGYEPPVTIYRVRYTGNTGGRQMMPGGRNMQNMQNSPDNTANRVVEKITYGGDDRSGRQRKFEEYVSTYNDLVEAYENYLWTTGQPSATDYAIAEGNVQVAQIEYDKALEEYLSYGDTPREKDVNAAQIALNNAEASYNQRFIIAPFDGTVTSVSAVEGYYVTRGSTALRLDDMTRIFIPISIPELDVSTVVNGTKVSITVDAISGKTFSGHIYTVSDAGDASGNAASFSAVVEVDDPDEHMLAGMTAEIAMKLDPRTDVLLIPTAAISYLDGEPTVTIADGETRRTIGIKLGTVTDNIAEVTSGNLTEGTQLIVSRLDQEVLLRLGLDPAEIMGQSGMIPAEMPPASSSEAIFVWASVVPPEAPAVIPTTDPADIRPSEENGKPREFPPVMNTVEVTDQSAPDPEQMPLPPSSEAIYVRASAVPSEASTDIPTAAPTTVPTDLPSSEENGNPQEIAPAVTPTATVATEDPASDRPVPGNMPEGNPFSGGQMPFPGEGGNFPEMPEGMQMPSMGEGGQFPGMPGGQRPDMSGNGQFRPPSGGQRPDANGSGEFQRPSGGQWPGGDSSGQFPGAGQRPQGTVTPTGKPSATPAPNDNITDKG